MISDIGSRLLFTLETAKWRIAGTYHRPRIIRGSSSSAGEDTIGVVFLNSLAPTRAGKGDSTVSWADSLADHGIPAIRIDLPGFGDASGELPVDLVQFINSGEYAPVVAEAVRKLLVQFGLSKVILVGLCAGAVSAIYTAAIAPNDVCGLILLDPYFYLPVTEKKGLGKKLADLVPPGAIRRLLKYVMHRLTMLRLTIVSNNIPSNANRALLDRVSMLAKFGTPILVLDPPAVTRKGENFDYLLYISERAAVCGRVEVRLVPGADHTFANKIGRSAMTEESLRWLGAYLQLCECSDVDRAAAGLFL